MRWMAGHWWWSELQTRTKGKREYIMPWWIQKFSRLFTHQWDVVTNKLAWQRLPHYWKWPFNYFSCQSLKHHHHHSHPHLIPLQTQPKQTYFTTHKVSFFSINNNNNNIISWWLSPTLTYVCKSSKYHIQRKGTIPLCHNYLISSKYVCVNFTFTKIISTIHFWVLGFVIQLFYKH